MYEFSAHNNAPGFATVVLPEPLFLPLSQAQQETPFICSLPNLRGLHFGGKVHIANKFENKCQRMH